MSIDLKVFRRLVRPTRIVPLSVAPDISTEEPVLLYGDGEVGVQEFARVAPLVGWGSAVVLTGVPTPHSQFVDRAEQIARASVFRTWFRGEEVPGFPPDARSWIKSEFDGNTYATHLPHVLEAVRQTTGAVLELGSGDGSTPALHRACAGRLLVTVDNNEEWLGKFRHLETEIHRMVCLSDPAEYLLQNTQEWGVVFVDHAPGESRAKAIHRVRNRAEYILMHDSEDLGYLAEDLLASFKYRKDFRKMRPWTTVVSEFREVWR